MGCVDAAGTHISSVLDKIVDQITKKVLGKNKTLVEKTVRTLLRKSIILVVKALLPDPTFSGVTKSALTLPTRSFTFAVDVEESFVNKLDQKLGLSKAIEQESFVKTTASAVQKMDQAVRKRTNPALEIPKYVGATAAGSSQQVCTLIVAEGDSAATLARVGRSELGMDKYGVFPLRGVLPNALQTSITDLVENQEIKSLLKILGIQIGQPVPVSKMRFELCVQHLTCVRYQKLVVMTDKDPDGEHICGEIVALIATLAPHVLSEDPDFVQRMATPVVRAIPNGKPSHHPDTLEFMTIGAAEKWFEQHPVESKRYRKQYLKGLATSTNEDAKVYFGDLDHHLASLRYTGEPSDKMIQLAFAKDRANDRKAWLQEPYDESFQCDFAQSFLPMEEVLVLSCFAHKAVVLKGVHSPPSLQLPPSHPQSSGLFRSGVISETARMGSRMFSARSCMLR